MATFDLPSIDTPYRTKHELVYITLHSAILNCDLKPGQKLTVGEIAEQLGVSSIPVRQALTRLEAEGFVETNSHKGARVANVSPDSLREVFLALAALRGIAGRYACERITPETLQRLETLCAESQEATDRGDLETSFARAREFHNVTVQAANMPFLEEMTNRAQDRSQWLFRVFLSSDAEMIHQRMLHALRERWDILAALKKGDPEEVERTIREHSFSALATYMQFLQATTFDHS